MANKTPNQQKNTEGLVAVESALSRTEQFIEDNQKLIFGIILGVVLIIGGYVAYVKFVTEPRNEEAISQMFVAEKYFERDSFNLALNGDANYPGFLGIIDDYSGTKSANLAKYYAGVCYMQLGQFDNAIEYLKDFSTSDLLLAPIAKGLIGDAYMEKNMVNDAITYYKNAIEVNNNDLTTPLYLYKLGRSYELINKNEDALTAYEKIYKSFPRSSEARTIEKNITAVKIKLGQI